MGFEKFLRGIFPVCMGKVDIFGYAERDIIYSALPNAIYFRFCENVIFATQAIYFASVMRYIFIFFGK